MRYGKPALVALGLLFVAFTCATANAQTARQIAQQTFPSVALILAEDKKGNPFLRAMYSS